MKTKQTILKAFASVALAIGAFASADAQSNLGAACGCPPVASRPEVLVTSLVGNYTPIAGTYGGELTQNTTFTCSNTYILDAKIYVKGGVSLTIEPGTVIKGAPSPVSQPANASALIIERNAKIFAQGTESCPIVFTAQADPMDGTYPIYEVGKWGGVVVLGKATNNLTLAANGPFVAGGAGKLAVADGVGTVEGFASSNPQDQYGVTTSIPVAYPQYTSPVGNYTFNQNITATATTNGVTTITVASTTYVLVGQSVSGSNIADGTTVVSIASGGVVTLSGTQSGITTSTPAIFTAPYPLSGLVGNFYAGAAGTGITSGNPATLVNFGPVVNGVNYAIPFMSNLGSTDDNDNSGVMQYVSIRHSGAILAVGAEINGLTLASVGRGTTIDHIEIVSCADDNIEVFGGTVNLKYITTLFGNDDMFDYDLGYKGNVQFFYGMKNTGVGPAGGSSLGSPDNDNGIEGDSDDNTSNSSYRSTPKMYNFTIMGNGKAAGTADNRGVSAAMFKDGAQGELFNSVFANFKNGVCLQVSPGAARPVDTYESWNTGLLKIKCNSFVGIGGTTLPVIENNFLVKGANSLNSIGAVISTDDATKFLTTDLNESYFDRAATTGVVEPTAIPGFSYAFTVNASNVVSVKNDVTPNPALTVSTTDCPTPIDGFFEPARYRGAFSSTLGDNWLSNWSYSQVLNSTSGVRACPTDINNDGITNTADFLIFGPAFGTSCN